MNLEIKKLGDVCDFYNGKAHEKSISDSGEIKVVNSKFVSSEGNKYKLTEQAIFPLSIGDICLVMSDVPNGKTLAKCFLVDADDTYSLNQRVCAIRSSQFDVKFLFYQLNRHPFLLGFNNGENQSNLRKADILNCPLWVPPIPEQKRIVALLDTVFADLEQTRAKTEKNLKNARELFDSYLQQVFSQKGEGWVDTDIESLVGTGILDKPIDGNHGETHPKKADFVEVGVPFIMASDIKDGVVDTKNCSFLSRTQADSLRKGFAKDGDVLLSHKATIGRTAILKTDLDYVMLTPQVTYYRVLDNQSLSNEYVYWYFNNPIFLNEMNEYAGVGSTRAYIGITKQRKLKFSYPEMATQKEIVSKLKLMSKEIANLEPIYKAKLLAIDELKKSILQKTFSGQLTTTGI